MTLSASPNAARAGVRRIASAVAAHGTMSLIVITPLQPRAPPKVPSPLRSFARCRMKRVPRRSGDGATAKMAQGHSADRIAVIDEAWVGPWANGSCQPSGRPGRGPLVPRRVAAAGAAVRACQMASPESGATATRCGAVAVTGGTPLDSTIINLIIQAVAGAIGGNAAGSAMKNASLGGAGNTIAGAIGGVGGGQLLTALIPMLQGTAGGGFDIGAIIGQVVGGGVGGAILTAIVGMIKNSMAKA